MDVLSALRERRSIRKFKKAQLPKEKIDAILEAASWAPSAGNLQARSFITVCDETARNKLAEAAYGQRFIAEAPAAIVVCAEHATSGSRYGKRGSDLYAIQDATAAAQNILIASHALGLGSCWVGAFSETQVKKLLEIPDGVTPVAIIPVGIPDEKPSAPKRKKEVHTEKW
jgi:nitroreductase